MTNPDETLAHIDAALADPGVSPDAMRWTPEPAPAPAGGGDRGDRGDPEWLEEWLELARWRMRAAAGIDWPVLRAATRRLGERARRASAGLHRMGHTAYVADAASVAEFRRRRRRHARCRVCRPHSNPPPLPIDGGEYRRRRSKR